MAGKPTSNEDPINSDVERAEGRRSDGELEGRTGESVGRGRLTKKKVPHARIVVQGQGCIMHALRKPKVRRRTVCYRIFFLFLLSLALFCKRVGIDWKFLASRDARPLGNQGTVPYRAPPRASPLYMYGLPRTTAGPEL